ncbi:MAG: prepilin-type N-terminal cleavage/methylation domain-containing protein [Candidatus Margulisiibacteriota bacterium]
MRKGFSLVEMIIALSLFACLFCSLYYFTGQSIRFWQRAADNCSHQQTENFVLEQIITAVRQSDQIMPTSSTSTLILSSEGENLQYSLTNHKVQRKKNGSIGYLTDENEINQLSFAYPSAKRVQISLETVSAEAYMRNGNEN